MRMLFLIGLLAMLGAAPSYAQDLATTCHATSSYDLTLHPDSLSFDRPSPAPMRVEMQQDNLRADGTAVTLTPAQQDRLSLFERDLRALAPRVRKVAQNGVDMAVQAVQSEVAVLGLSGDTRAEFDRKLASHAAELKQRIARSQSTHDWDGDAMQQYADQVSADLMPLVAADLGQQAINMAMTGDLQAAARLRDGAGSLVTGLKPRLEQSMQALRPQIDALCPAIQRLSRLQQGLRDSKGQPLNLLQVGSDGTAESAASAVH
ncbi:MAG: DUF2884 family protein [Rhodanobacter sp.]